MHSVKMASGWELVPETMAKRSTIAAFEDLKLCHPVFFHGVVFFSLYHPGALVQYFALKSDCTAS